MKILRYAILLKTLELLVFYRTKDGVLHCYLCFCKTYLELVLC